MAISFNNTLLLALNPHLRRNRSKLGEYEIFIGRLPTSFGDYLVELKDNYCQRDQSTNKQRKVVQLLFPALLNAFFTSKSIHALLKSDPKHRLEKLVTHKIDSMRRKIARVETLVEMWKGRGNRSSLPISASKIKKYAVAFMHATKECENQTDLILELRHKAGELSPTIRARRQAKKKEAALKSLSIIPIEPSRTSYRLLP